MIEKLLSNAKIKRLFSSFAVVAVLCVMTGPPGSTATPMAGITGSFTTPASFFGLFSGQRWMVFFVLALVFFAVWTFWLKRGSQVKGTVSKSLTQPREMLERRPIRIGVSVLFLVIAIALPHFVTDPFWQDAMVEQIAVFVLLALGLNVVVGFAGLLDLGFVAFYAIGAYATAWVTGALPLPPLFGIHLDSFAAIPVAIVLAMLFGVILGTPTLRLRGDYLAIVTLGFGEIIFIFANNLTGITGGAAGTNAIPHYHFHISSLNVLWGLGPVPYYYLTLAFVVIFLVIFSMLEHSRIGRSWTAIREDEVAAESVGINPLKYKVMAFAIGAASAGFAGSLTASQITYVSPSTFTVQFSINILVLVIFGGMGSITGVLVGAIIIQTISMYLIHTPPAGFQAQDLYIYIGALLMVMMIFRPSGLIPSKRRKREIRLSEAGEGHMDEVLTGDTP